ncbi:TlpA disulfide reductase family protein [Sphingobacterium sp. DR205]|uniref:TlpA family protein disulfide reductase n=1 Tax=Sphingobacterium sp. DR205 TaxID=2713573 RepID=UPI0013E454CE|nr:TlpA disulfide reductase family protein [Sphingobacterium sp. DR205]QIH32841.1 TlpA family protein disulfide reductase [Sphingobacterium sp. DR205]
MRKLIMTLGLLIAFQISFGQHNANVDLSNQLKISAAVPDMPAMEILNFSGTKVDLDDYKDKVLILDFWDTSCATCIQLMPHVKEVQKEVGDKAQIFAVTWQSKELITEFYKKNKYLKEKNAYLPTIVSDSLLKKYFPYQGVPHTVFIYMGKVKAITYPDYIKSKFIDELIANEKLDIPVKDDFNTKTVIHDSADANLKGKVLITGYRDDLQFKGGLPIEKDSVTGMYVTSLINTSIFNAFKRLYNFIDPPNFLWIPGRVEWNVKDPSMYEYQSNTIGPRIWDTKYAICYQRFSQDTLSKKEMAKLVMNDLVSFLGVSASIEKKEKDVIIIRKTDKSQENAVKPTDGRRVEGADNLAFLLDVSELYPPAFDESGFKEIIEIPDYSSLEKLNEQILYYGLEAVREKKVIEVMIIKERGH